MPEDQGVFVANTVFVDRTGAEVSDCWTGPQVLYKYRSPSMRALESLTLNQVWFAQPKTFNDPFESSKFFDAAAIEEMVRRMMEDGEQDEERVRRYIDFGLNPDIEDSGIFCLCRTADNLAMWSYYGADEQGAGLKGFAVGYDLVSLLYDLQPLKMGERECGPRNRFVFDVAYRGERELPSFHTLIWARVKDKGPAYLKMHATKALAFKHEDEVRIVIPPPLEILVGGGSINVQPYGAYAHAREAIREIVFGELIEPVHEEMIRKIMAGRDVVFKRASRDLQSLSIKLETEA